MKALSTAAAAMVAVALTEAESQGEEVIAIPQNYNPPEPDDTAPRGPYNVVPGSVYAEMFGFDKDPETLTSAEREKLKYWQRRKAMGELRKKHGNWVGKHAGAVAIASSGTEIIQMAPPKNPRNKSKGNQGAGFRVRRAAG